MTLEQAQQDIQSLLGLDALDPGNLSQSEKELVEEIRQRWENQTTESLKVR